MKYIICFLIFFLYFKNTFTKETILLQSTTSTKNSGFYDYILPKFERETGIVVRVVAVGTGAAIRNIMNCDGDALLVHNPTEEIKLLSTGHVVNRKQFMHNDYVIIGPYSDSAKILKVANPYKAFRIIAQSNAKFLSRGDNSGTHNFEKKIWDLININPLNGKGVWYFETGSSMGATINTAIGLEGYTLTDRATWLSFGNQQDYEIMVESSLIMQNKYSILLVNKQKCPNTNFVSSQIFIKWLTSERGQKLINSFKLNEQQLFFPSIYK